MRKTLRELVIDYANNKQTFKRAQNRSKFIALWPEIKALLDEGCSLKDINEVAKAHGLLNLHYDSFRRYVIQKRKMEEVESIEVTPEKGNTSSRIPSVQNSLRERKVIERNKEAEKPLPYSVPPKFTGGRGDDDEDITTFLLGKGK